MVDRKDGGPPPVHALTASRPQRDSRKTVSRPLDDADSLTDPVAEVLKRLGDDIINEPVPDRLLEALRKKPSSKS